MESRGREVHIYYYAIVTDANSSASKTTSNEKQAWLMQQPTSYQGTTANRSPVRFEPIQDLEAMDA